MKTPTESVMVLAVADIAGFARACRGKSDAETFAMLDRFYRLVGKTVPKAGGTVVKLMGDCAFVVFPGNKAREAVGALQDLKAGAGDMWAAFGSACRLRVHAHIGRVASGRIGPDRRFDVVGKSVNELFMMPWDGPEWSEAMRKVAEE